MNREILVRFRESLGVQSPGLLDPMSVPHVFKIPGTRKANGLNPFDFIYESQNSLKPFDPEIPNLTQDLPKLSLNRLQDSQFL